MRSSVALNGPKSKSALVAASKVTPRSKTPSTAFSMAAISSGVSSWTHFSGWAARSRPYHAAGPVYGSVGMVTLAAAMVRCFRALLGAWRVAVVSVCLPR